MIEKYSIFQYDKVDCKYEFKYKFLINQLGIDEWTFKQWSYLQYKVSYILLLVGPLLEFT